MCASCAPANLPEDAGPMAHPVRPDSFVEINNFYTVTIYEKGSEVVRMYQTLLGRKRASAKAWIYTLRGTTDKQSNAMTSAQRWPMPMVAISVNSSAGIAKLARRRSASKLVLTQSRTLLRNHPKTKLRRHAWPAEKTPVPYSGRGWFAGCSKGKT